MRKSFSSLLSLLAISVSSSAVAVGLPDTGQSTCYNGSTLVTCSSANTGDTSNWPRQDGRFGNDNTTGLEYVSLDSNGNQLGTDHSAASCVRDLNTELTWEFKSSLTSHLRYSGWTYTWFNSDSATHGGWAGVQNAGTCVDTVNCDTEKYAAQVNANNLCGFSDWRLPTERELETIVHYNASNPAINSTYFINTINNIYMSATPDAANSNNYRSVGFSNGNSSSWSKSQALFVRLVRGEMF